MQEKIETLVRQVVAEFLQNESQKSGTPVKKYPVFILIDQQPDEVPSAVWEKIQKLDEHYHITVCTPSSITIPASLTDTHLILSEDHLSNIKNALRKSELLILANSQYSHLAKLALTIDDTLGMWILIQTQLNGKKIVMLKDSLTSTGSQVVTAPHQVSDRVQSYIRQLQQERISFVTLKQLGQWLDSFFEESSPPRHTVLAKHIQQVANDGERILEVPEDSLITPMSKDLARELGVSIKQKE
ncbi:hypothetical protein RZN25_07915 [Bacillaceae bacterium S4-13-56]